MLGNIFNNAKTIFDFSINRDDYWDMVLCNDPQSYMDEPEGIVEDCLISYIDINDTSCLLEDGVASKEGYIWGCGYNDGISLENIGYTGIDNGLIRYDKGRISNEDFWRIYTKSSYNIDKGDLRLILRYVDGNNRIYTYPHSLNDGAISLDGGFLQGFFQLDGYRYKVLPSNLFDGWSLEFTLKGQKGSGIHNLPTLNDVHPENKGIFFYIGTRAENKWWKYFKTNGTFAKKVNAYHSDGYMDGCDVAMNKLNGGYQKDEDGTYLNNPYVDDYYSYNDYFTIGGDDCKPQKLKDEAGYFGEYGRYIYDKGFYDNTDVWSSYTADGYFGKDREITGKEQLFTADGFNLKQPNINVYETDNKFMFFNKTSSGFNVNNWKEGGKVTMYDITAPNMPNYFTLFDQTGKGYTTDTIGKLEDEMNKSYDVLSDLYRNALAFQVTDKGEVGYKYLVKDCESELESYKIESEFSKQGIFNNDEWHTIHVRIEPVKTNIARTEGNCSCNIPVSGILNTMKMYFYVDARLVLISKELPMLNLKRLNDLYGKQESVPYNISIGGGTQGLCDTVYAEFMDIPEYELPLEREFAGSFIGEIRSFKFYECPLDFQQIKANFNYERAQ